MGPLGNNSLHINRTLVIDMKIDSNPQELLNAPISTPVRRLDETKANRDPNVRW